MKFFMGLTPQELFIGTTGTLIATLTPTVVQIAPKFMTYVTMGLLGQYIFANREFQPYTNSGISKFLTAIGYTSVYAGTHAAINICLDTAFDYISKEYEYHIDKSYNSFIGAMLLMTSTLMFPKIFTASLFYHTTMVDNNIVSPMKELMYLKSDSHDLE